MGANSSKLRELASWYREFAERAGNPLIWEARLRTAQDLDKEADHIDRDIRSETGQGVRAQGPADQMRRLGDLVIACMLLAVTLPLMIIAALVIKWESPGPVLDRQTFNGRGGRRFQMLKFRTTIYDPDHATPTWAQKTTQVGQFLRQTRIDALPQLINVVLGEMSFIDHDAGSPSFLD